VLAVFSLAAVWFDPAEPARFAATTYSLHLGYLAYSLVLGLFTWQRAVGARLAAVTHLGDIAIFSVFQYLTLGPSSPFFVYDHDALMTSETSPTSLLDRVAALAAGCPSNPRTPARGSKCGSRHRCALPIRVILADDHPIVLHGLERMFESHPDFQVAACCRDADAAIAAVRKRNADVLVLDCECRAAAGSTSSAQWPRRSSPAGPCC
jgi:hypothetical protein